MAFSLKDLYRKCEDKDCNKLFLPSYETVEMQVTLEGAIQKHIYCSERCFENTLANVNKNAGEFERIKLDFKEKVSSKPDKWLVAYVYDIPEIKFWQ